MEDGTEGKRATFSIGNLPSRVIISGDVHGRRRRRVRLNVKGAPQRG